MTVFNSRRIEDLEGEVWKPIRDSKRYLVSNKGRVKSLTRQKPLILSQKPNNNGYYRVCLSLTRGKPKYYLVSRLVAEAFIVNDNPAIKRTVHHIDENKENNTVDNLQWLSLGDNIREHYKKKAEANNGKE